MSKDLYTVARRLIQQVAAIDAIEDARSIDALTYELIEECR